MPQGEQDDCAKPWPEPPTMAVASLGDTTFGFGFDEFAAGCCFPMLKTVGL